MGCCSSQIIAVIGPQGAPGKDGAVYILYEWEAFASDNAGANFSTVYNEPVHKYRSVVRKVSTTEPDDPAQAEFTSWIRFRGNDPDDKGYWPVELSSSDFETFRIKLPFAFLAAADPAPSGSIEIDNTANDRLVLNNSTIHPANTTFTFKLKGAPGVVYTVTITKI
jgi:hypothetical protein